MKTIQDIRLHSKKPVLSLDWCLKNAIKERVQLEDLVRWSGTEEVGVVLLEQESSKRVEILAFVKGLLP